MAANNKISKKGTFGTTMGVTSIIAILVILVLIVFSALSITTSKADFTLAEKTAQATSEFYEADNAAEQKLAEIAEVIAQDKAWRDLLKEQGYTVKKDGDGNTKISYDVAINENKALFVVLSVDASGDISREQWQVQSTSDWEAANGFTEIS